jgi:NAD kinase
MIELSRHAAKRSKERSVPPFIIGLLIDYGRVVRRKGAAVYFFDKRSRKTLKKEMGSLVYERLDDLFDNYVVVGDDGAVVTTAHRTKRMKV